MTPTHDPGEGAVASKTPATFADELLAAASVGQDPAGLAERISTSRPAEAVAVLEALGRSRSPAAASILVAAAETGGSKELRKEARRGLHRLRALGFDVPNPSPPRARPVAPEREVQVAEAWAGPPDGIGSRVLWIVVERPLGGIYAAGMILNDVVGMKACSVEETTRKRFSAKLAAWETDQRPRLIPLPPRYATQLVGEALELNRESGFTVPRDYQFYERALGSPAQPFERAIVYESISSAEVRLDPELLEESPTLLDEEELKSWFFGFDEVRSFALDLLQARQSQIVLSEELQKERIDRITSNAIREVVTPPIQRGLRRRLEEVAYIFVNSGRQRLARLALAAAQQLAEGAITLHPLLKAMMGRSLDIATEVEMAKVPVDLVRRSPYDPIE
jgi:hypothetical protein